jgi:hypothetical protein
VNAQLAGQLAAESAPAQRPAQLAQQKAEQCFKTKESCENDEKHVVVFF